MPVKFSVANCTIRSFLAKDIMQAIMISCEYGYKNVLDGAMPRWASPPASIRFDHVEVSAFRFLVSIFRITADAEQDIVYNTKYFNKGNT